MTYSNPLLSGFHPDPSICRVGDDYYLVTSTFEYFPGLPLFQSRDLVNWRPVGYAMSTPESLRLVGCHPSQGLYAPTIRHHNGRFYVVCTNVSDGGNFVVWSDAIEGPWSNPERVPDAEGIDPSLFFDEDGRCWWIGHGAPEVPLYPDHKLVWLQEFDIETFQLKGPKRIVVSGGSDLAKKPVWLEGPHLYRIGEYYYIFAAEGGTERNHSEVVFRSRHIEGPYESMPGNPLVSHRDLPFGETPPITCTGHADLVETQRGEWYMVLLGSRPYADYEVGRTNLGRETFMVPVRWEDGWPVVEDRRVRPSYPLPNLPIHSWGVENYAEGSRAFRDDFSGLTLRAEWTFLRSSRDFYRLSETGLEITPSEIPLESFDVPSFLGIRQRAARCRAGITVEAGAERTGLTVLYSGFNYVAVELEDGQAWVRRVVNGEVSRTPVSVVGSGAHRLELEIVDDKVHVYVDGTPVASNVDGSHLNSVTSGGFVGCFLGLYAVGSADGRIAVFRDFEYCSVE